MNERIKELAERARQYAEEKQNDPLKIYTLDCFNEKFAELIVKECMNTVSTCNGITKFEHWTAIKEHFGIKL